MSVLASERVERVRRIADELAKEAQALQKHQVRDHAQLRSVVVANL